MTNPGPAGRSTPIRIDIVSDVVCPWCIIGYKQLERALASTGVPAVIYWHPFELNPTMADHGENLRNHVAAKYGATPDDGRRARAKLTAIGAELGFTFNYTDDMRMVNTFRAHQLLYWAETEARTHDLEMALFRAFFTEQRDLNNPEVLADVAGGIGLDRDEALAVLEDGRFAEAVRRVERFWLAQGVRGVPAMVFDQRHLVSGAQSAENYGLFLEQLAAGDAA
jgi:predicted DsbA family dithiol-disulfide isomerase